MSSLDAFETIRADVLERIERRRLHVGTDHDVIAGEVEAAVGEYQRRAEQGELVPLADPGATAQRLLRSVGELGPLGELLTRPDVEEVFIEGARVSYLDGDGTLRGLTVPIGEAELRQIVDRLLTAGDRHLDGASPLVQARVLGGAARLTAAIAPVSDRLSATLRRYTVRDVTLDDLVVRGSLSASAAAFLRVMMQFRSRVAVSGEPGAGKTTMLAALLAAAPSSHCVRCCEEIRELAVPFNHGSYYEARPPSLDGRGEISLRHLVKFVLAMRPDRIVVGEVRGGEAFELTRAVNAGCGFLCTVHANSGPDALQALVNAALMAGENVTERIVTRVFSDALDFVIHIDRDTLGDGPRGVRRRVAEITAVVPAMGESFSCEPVFVRDRPAGPLEWTGVVPDRLEERADRALGRRGALRSVLAQGSVG